MVYTHIHKDLLLEEYIESGDLNNDESTDVLDVVQLVNCILFSDGCTICFDINEDEEYNVLDVLDLINIIINTD